MLVIDLLLQRCVHYRKSTKAHEIGKGRQSEIWDSLTEVRGGVWVTLRKSVSSELLCVNVVLALGESALSVKHRSWQVIGTLEMY